MANTNGVAESSSRSLTGTVCHVSFVSFNDGISHSVPNAGYATIQQIAP
jgi:hypothetical protein